MTQARIQQALQDMAALDGLEGCALVEVQAGMVWHHAGRIDGVQQLAEAASDYWRLYQRLANQFEDLGDLRACAMMHANGRLTLLPCGKGMLLVALTRQQTPVDWATWQTRTRELARLVADL